MLKNSVKKSLSVVVLLAVFLLSCMVVRAVVEKKDGGLWDHGVNRWNPFAWTVWSHYHHCERRHHSWCTSGAGDTYQSPVTKPGEWSRSKGAASFQGCTTHYAFDD